MDIEHKAFGASINAQPEGVIEAIVSTFDNVDYANEIVRKGAFEKSLKARLPRLVWAHDWSRPIGKTLEARETDEGLYVKGQLNLNTTAGHDAFEHLKAGDISEFSIGYRVIQDDHQEKDIRELLEVNLFEVSCVLVGMNPATSLISIKSNEPDTLANQVESMLACGVHLASRFKALHELRAKEGRVFSANNRSRITACVGSMRTVADDLHSLLELTEPQPKAAEDVVLRTYAEFLHTVVART